MLGNGNHVCQIEKGRINRGNNKLKGYQRKIAEKWQPVADLAG